ncbi:EAL domain-containing protein [Altericista sp. CCNU0014]|uniref:EAL domain-containing protein n=1 Tax=Altericista sp. CCNU0014 TaxID=3082949 RepID=UPI003850F10D
MNRRIIQGAIAIVVLISGLALAGWQFHIFFLKNLWAGNISTMKANTALGLMLSSLSLGLLQGKRLSRLRCRIAQAMAVGAIALGALTLMQYFWGWDLGIDRWLFRDLEPSATTLYPGRMGINTAVNFVLLGVGLLLLTSKTRRRIVLAQLLACIVALLAWMAFCGHLFGVDVQFKVVAHIFTLAPNTSVAFMALCVGILVTYPRQGLMQHITSPLVGGIIARRVIPWAIALPMGLSWLVRQGTALGHYDNATDDVLVVMAMTIAFSSLVWWNARLLNQMETQRIQIETDLQQANEQHLKATERTDILRYETQRLSEIVQLQQEVALRGFSLDEAMTLIVERAQQLTHASGSIIEMVEGNELVYRAASGQVAPYVGLRLKVNASLSGYCLTTGEILHCQDVATDPHVDLEACRRIGIQSMIVVPFQTTEGYQGVLKVSASNPHAFTDQDVQVLQLLAAFLASSLQLASEFEAKNALLLALQDSEERYRSVIEALAEGIILQDSASTILASNASAEAILGLSLAQMKGRSSLDPRWQAIHEDGSPFPGEQHPTIMTLRTGKSCRNVIMGIRKPDDRLTWISVNSQPLFHPDELLPYAVVASFSDITEQKQAKDALKQSEAELQALFAAMTDIVLVRDAQGLCLKVATTHAQGLYQPIEAMVGKTLHETFPLPQADAMLNYIQQALETQQTVQGEYSLEMEGRQHHFSTNFSPMSADAVVLVVRDISAQKQLEQDLFEEKELAQVTLHSIGDAVITTDAEGRIKYFNPVAASLTGWNPQETAGLPFGEVFKIFNEVTGEPVENPLERALQEGHRVGLPHQTILMSLDGREIHIEDSAAPIRDREGRMMGAVMVFHDVTQARRLSQQLTWEASHDALTHLINRREFEQRVEQALASAQSQNQVHALCYLDLDRFKIVNDNCGHAAGDELLRQITVLLQTQVRKSDTLARLGGDEFGILLNECPLDQALRIANQMRECVQSFRFIWQDQTFAIGASIGLTAIDAESESLSSLLSVADAACYTAKNKGRNRVHVFQPNDRDLLQQRGEIQWASRLSRALEEDRFCLYYQPIAAVTTPAQSEHYEVLVRLIDEQGNLVAPMAFIPAAERYNLMHLIDRWVIKTLFKTQGSHYREIWQQCQLEGVSCDALYAINLSGASINDDQFMDFVQEQFALHQIPAPLICFEITETLAIANLTKARQFIHELQRLGCHFALDDFGSGMSSFGYLKNLPVNYLKIDGSFIRNIVKDPVDEAMVEAMVRIGHVMGMKLIAEFVENDAILERIKVLGIDYAQGYGIAAPRPLT